MDIKEDLHYLAVKRKKLELQKLVEESLQKQLESTSEYLALKSLRQHMGNVKDDIARVELQIKSNAVEESRLSNYEERKLYDVIQIKEFSVIRILDEEEAKQWASQNAPSLLSLNKSKFNTAVKALELDFVYKDKEYRAQIASDLSQYENSEGNTSPTTEE